MKIGVYFDTQNLWFSAVNFGRENAITNARVDYQKLLKKIAGDREVVIAKAFVVEHPQFDAGGFSRSLKANGIEPFKKQMRAYQDKKPKADWDVGIAVEAMLDASKYDILCVCTGDGDQIPLVQAIVDMGKVVEVYSFKDSLSGELGDTATKTVYLDEEILFPGKERENNDD